MQIRSQVAADAVRVAPAVAGSVAAWTFAGHTWADISAFLSAIYVLIMILENLWRKLLRPALARRGYIEQRRHRVTDPVDPADEAGA